MSSNGTVPPKFTPPVSKKLSSAEMALHLRQLYLITNQHDQAIIKVNDRIPTTTTPGSTPTSTTILTGVTSFNSTTGAITFFPNLGQVNNQTGKTAYTIQSSDDGQAILLSDASPIAVTLNSGIVIPWYAVIFNQGAGAATLTPTTGLINGGASLILPGNGFAIIYFDGTNWEAGTTQSGAVSQIVAGTNITISPPGGTGVVTINSTGGAVSQIIAGTNVTISPLGGTGAVTVNATVPAALNFADNETPSGALSGVTFTLAHSPNPPASLILVSQGQTLWQDPSGDYTLSGNTITFATAPLTGPLIAWYRY